MPFFQQNAHFCKGDVADHKWWKAEKGREVWQPGRLQAGFSKLMHTWQRAREAACSLMHDLQIMAGRMVSLMHHVSV